MVNAKPACKKAAAEVIVNESPIKWCSATLSDVLSHGKRLEASVFDIEAKQAYNRIIYGKYPAVHLIGEDGPVQRAYYGDRLKRHYVDKRACNTIGFLGSAEMLDCKPVPDKFMSDDERVDDLRVNQGTVLISRSGTIGNVTYVGKTLSQFLVSEHAIRIECREYGGYVYAFLKSKTGKKIVCSTKYGAVIQEIEPEHLAAVPIPDPPAMLKKKINDLIVHSFELRDESNELIDTATALLKEELQLPDINDFHVDFYGKEAPVDTFNVKLSGMVGRLDASYHVPVVDAILQHLQEHAREVTTIGNERISSDVVLPGRFKRVYVDAEYGVKFLGGKEMKQLDPSGEKYLSKRAHKKQLEGALSIKPYSILTPARGSLGEVIMPCKHFLNWAISDNMMQIFSNEDICGYLYIFLNSEYGKALIQRFTYGGVVDAIEPAHIQQVQVPLLKDQTVQNYINNLAFEANEKRFEAYQLEQEALRTLDEEVICAAP